MGSIVLVIGIPFIMLLIYFLLESPETGLGSRNPNSGDPGSNGWF
jgi:hypothetical protein